MVSTSPQKEHSLHLKISEPLDWGNMLQTQIRYANSEEEVNLATTVAAKSFYPDIEDVAKFEALRGKWGSDPFLDKKFLILAFSGGEIVGGLRTTPFTIFRMSQEFRCLGIAEIFVSANFQGLGIASQLVDHLISTTKDSNYDLILGVARKKIDGFYLKKGFYGIGSYPKCFITGIRESNKFRILKSDSFEFHPKMIDQNLNSYYETSYKNQFGRRLRAKADWEKIQSENQLNGYSCLGIYLSGEMVGYFICHEKVILEISFREDLSLVNLISDLSEYLQVNELQLEISPSHLLLRNDLGFDITMATRECFFGGHIARIVNLESLVNKFISREDKVLSRSGDKVIQLIIGNERIQIDLLKKTIMLVPVDSSPKLFSSEVVGIETISFEMTKLLLGSKSEYQTFCEKEFIFSREPFQISTIDEF